VTTLIEKLPPGVCVLDLGARSGSFDTDRVDITVIRLDLEPPLRRKAGTYVRGDAARLPLARACFAMVISNHSLEHFAELDETLLEVARVIRPDGVFYVAVPDAGTFTDRLYRWMAKGGGHVNRFHSATEVATRVERLTGLPHRATVPLFSSLSFLNAHNFTARPPRKIALFGFGNERFLAVFMWCLRCVDGWFGTRLSRYGWAFYFGSYRPPERIENWINVCVRCGSGHSEVFLKKKGAIPPLPSRFDWYRCPVCGGVNLLTHEK
jgi:SAM-dependent methyltransferase